MSALKDLGCGVKAIKEVKYATGHVAIANGDAQFMADHWNPLHADFFMNAGGDAKLSRKGLLIPNNLENKGKSTKLANGKDYGFEVNSQHVVANKAFVDANPAAGKILRTRQDRCQRRQRAEHAHARRREGRRGHRSPRRGLDQGQPETYDGWLEQARAAKK